MDAVRRVRDKPREVADDPAPAMHHCAVYSISIPGNGLRRQAPFRKLDPVDPQPGGRPDSGVPKEK